MSSSESSKVLYPNATGIMFVMGRGLVFRQIRLKCYLIPGHLLIKTPYRITAGIADRHLHSDEAGSLDWNGVQYI